MKTPRHVRLLLTLLPLSLAAAQAQKATLVVSGFGIAQDKIEKNIAKPFEAVCGCNVVFEVGNNADRLAKLTARKANPNVDVVLLADYFAKQASNQGLLEKLDTAQLSNYGKLYDFARDPLKDGTAVAFTVYSVSIVYRTDKITKPITSWKDLWRPELAGKVALPNITTTQGPPTVWLVNRAYGGKDSDAVRRLWPARPAQGADVLQPVVAGDLAVRAGRDLGRAGGPFRVGRAAEHQKAPGLGAAVRRAGRTGERRVGGQGQQERGAGPPVHRLYAVDAGADGPGP